MRNKYITPKLRKLEFDQIENHQNQSYHSDDNSIKLNEIPVSQHTIILGEPGCGKSRLLKELFEKEINKSSSSCAFIDLKKVNAKLQTFIHDNVARKYDANQFYTEHFRGICFSKNFQLINNENTFLFLDALDEVQTDETKKSRTYVPQGNVHVFRFVTKIHHKEKMLNYLEKSFELLKKEGNEYHNFVDNKVWSVVTNYFQNLKNSKTDLQKHLTDLIAIRNKFPDLKQAYWFDNQINRIKQTYLNILSQPQNFSRSIQKYNELKKKQYLHIAYPEELFRLIKEVIDDEFRKWVHEGFYSVIRQLQSYKTKGHVQREALIQKTIVTQLENFLLKRNIRHSDIFPIFPKFDREVQKLDDDKVDLIITYGSIGSVMIEIKRATNSDLNKKNRTTYKTKKLLPYLRQTNCEFGIFLIFRDEEKLDEKEFWELIEQVKIVYQTESNICVIGIDCLSGIK